MPRSLFTLGFGFVAICLAQVSHAHEFWIDPIDPKPQAGSVLEARTFIGNAFDGEEVANHPSMQVRFDVTLGAVTAPITGIPDQLPAIQAPSLGEGLHILRYQSRDFQLTYETFDDFLAFLKEADRTDLADQHEAKGLPRDGIREVYFRYAKSLIGVGDGEGADKFLGMPWELVALTNPYTNAPDMPMQFELRFNDMPEGNAAVHVFIRASDEKITDIRLRSDSRGIVTVPTDVKGTYMVNAIKVLPASQRMEYLLGASWQSLWASSTYVIE